MANTCETKLSMISWLVFAAVACSIRHFKRRSHINLHALSIISLAIRSAHRTIHNTRLDVSPCNLSIVSPERRTIPLSLLDNAWVASSAALQLNLSWLFLFLSLSADRVKIIMQSDVALRVSHRLIGARLLDYRFRERRCNLRLALLFARCYRDLQWYRYTI